MKLNLIIPTFLVAAASSALASPQSSASESALVARAPVFEDVLVSFGRRDNAPAHERALAKRCSAHKKAKHHKKPKKHHKSSGGGSGSTKGSAWKPTDFTWYSGNDLKNPSCQSGSAWQPTDKAMIAATTMTGWTGAPKCGSFVQICKEKSGKGPCTHVRIADTCAGCAKSSSHLDLTKTAFEVMNGLGVGEFIGSFSVMPDGFVPPGGWSIEKYGPKVFH